MTLKGILIRSTNILKVANIDAPAVDAGVIICHVIKKDRTFLYAHDEYQLSQKDEKKVLELIKRRVHGEPVQYLTGKQEFMSLDFVVNENVLIPRNDTEILVETVLEYEKKTNEYKNRELHILDIGTGSGCIAISLACYISSCKVTAVDISEKALEVAKYNAKNNCVDDKIAFAKSDIFNDLIIENSTQSNRFDIIVSNPPYIPSSHIEGLQIEVKGYEPLNALVGGEDGLDFYRRITFECSQYIKPGGMLAFEVGYGQASSVAQLMSENFKDIEVIKDLSGIDRVVVGIRI